MTSYKAHSIKPFQQFTGAWLAVFTGPLTAGTVRGYTRRHATARAKLAILREYRSRADKSLDVLNNELRRASARTLAQTQALWAEQRRQEGLPPRYRVKSVDAAPKDTIRSAYGV